MKDIAVYFKISPTAAGIQNAEISNTPIEVTLTKNGCVYCSRINPSSPNQYAPKEFRVNHRPNTYDFYKVI